MATRLTRPAKPENLSALTAERAESFCPECGQSLDLFRHSVVSSPRKTREPWLFIAVGLCLALFFAVRALNAHGVIADLDQETAGHVATTMAGAYGAPSNQAMLQDDHNTPLLIQRAALKASFDQAVIGLGLALLAIAVGISAAIRHRWGFLGVNVPTSSGSPLAQVALCLWGYAEILGGSVLRTLLFVFAVFVSGQTLRGAPITPSLMDQAVGRTIDVVIAIGGRLL